MKTKSNLRLRKIGNRHMIIDNDTLSTDTTAVHSLNDTAAEIWMFAASRPQFTADDIILFLTDTYEVDAATAAADVEKLLSQWLSENLIEK